MRQTDAMSESRGPSRSGRIGTVLGVIAFVIMMLVVLSFGLRIPGVNVHPVLAIPAAIMAIVSLCIRGSLRWPAIAALATVGVLVAFILVLILSGPSFS